jgi:type II secretory pathway predicted ATPase ExeA
MTERESAEYVRHHLQLAGRKDSLFSDGALELLHAPRAGSRGS